MAFDGITIAAMVQELHRNLDGGRFNKIAQPESDALMITGKGANGQCRLLISALRGRRESKGRKLVNRFVAGAIGGFFVRAGFSIGRLFRGVWGIRFGSV